MAINLFWSMFEAKSVDSEGYESISS